MMGEEERNVRFENALATLAELAAVQNRRADAHERRIDVIEEAQALLARVLRSQQNWAEETKARHAEIDHKLAALVDAQMQTEEALKQLEEVVKRIADSHERLAGSHAHSDRRLDALIDVVRDLLNGRKPEGGRDDSGRRNDDENEVE